VAQKARKMAKTKIREKAKKQRLAEKEEKRIWLEYLKQLQDKKSTIEMTWLRWRILTPMKDVCIPDRTAWYIIQDEYVIFCFFYSC